MTDKDFISEFSKSVGSMSKEQLFNLAFHDSLTGLYNRSALEIMRPKIDSLYCKVMIADVDHLKEENDQFGHHKGDQLIIECAAILKKNSHVAFRLGGDEFLTLCFYPSVLMPIYSGPFDEEGVKTFQKMSIGHVIKSQKQSLSSAMREADVLMYYMKGEKKNARY